MFKLIWVVRVEGRKCLFEHYSDAKADFETHDPYRRYIYPKIILKKTWEKIPDFSGW